MQFAILLVLVVAPACFSDPDVPVRIGGNTYGSGPVEVFHNGEWGTVCAKNIWTLEDATVVCLQLGFKKAIYESLKAMNGQGTGNVLLSDVQCIGTEISILDCPSAGWGNVDGCDHEDDAGVGCTNEGLPEMTYEGCFVDQPADRTMPDLYENFRDGRIDWDNLRYTAVKCASGAVENDYQYYGVQYYGECYGAPGTPDYSQYGGDEGSCVEGVGLLSINAVYHLSPWEDLGCWADSQSSRTMQLIDNYRGNIDWDKLDEMVPKCYNAAKENGMKYFAIQFFGECWASFAETYKEHGQSTLCYLGVGEQYTNYVYKIFE